MCWMASARALGLLPPTMKTERQMMRELDAGDGPGGYGARVEDRQVAALRPSIKNLAEEPAGVFGARIWMRHEYGLTHVALRAKTKLLVFAARHIDPGHTVVEPGACDI